MVDQKATQVCLLAQEAYPEERRSTLVSSPPIGYLLRLERETADTAFRCIYAIADGRKIHDGPCRFDSWTPGEESTETAPAGADEPAADSDPETASC
jgi:hypothetical protein